MMYPLSRALLACGALFAVGLFGVIGSREPRARLLAAASLWVSALLACLVVSNKNLHQHGQVMLVVAGLALLAQLAVARALSADRGRT
jgi:NADH:ubiquinone oxidoreductase subunit K